MSAPNGLHGHIDDEGVRFKDYIESVAADNQLLELNDPRLKFYLTDAGERIVARLFFEGVDTRSGVFRYT